MCRRPAKLLTPRPKPVHPAPAQPAKLQMQKTQKCKTKCNAKQQCRPTQNQPTQLQLWLRNCRCRKNCIAKQLQCKINCNVSRLSSCPVKEVTSHPKPAHPAPAKPKKPQMQKNQHCKTKLQCKNNCNESRPSSCGQGLDSPPQTSPSGYREA